MSTECLVVGRRLVVKTNRAPAGKALPVETVVGLINFTARTRQNCPNKFTVIPRDASNLSAVAESGSGDDHHCECTLAPRSRTLSTLHPARAHWPDQAAEPFDEENTMSPEQNKAIFVRFMKELGKGNLAIIDEVCAPDFAFHSPMLNRK
jgi:hypothetical protein